jgi:hypothetical protein
VQGDARAAHCGYRLVPEALVDGLVQTTGSDASRVDDGGNRIRVAIDLPRALSRGRSSIWNMVIHCTFLRGSKC